MMHPKDIDVVILCGGLGTRLRRVVNDRPKPMAEINKRPFLDILIDNVSGYGFTRFILCTGYKGYVIRKYYESRHLPLTIQVSEEKEPLGTAGGIKHAESLIKSRFFLAMNGDSFCKLNILDFLDFHAYKKAFASVALVLKEKSVDCGVVRLNETNQIVSFHEKIEMNNNSLVNAGIYLFNKEVLSLIPTDRNSSLESDLFPNLIRNKGIYGFNTNQQLIDIGTPERYELAKKLFAVSTQSSVTRLEPCISL